MERTDDTTRNLGISGDANSGDEGNSSDISKTREFWYFVVNLIPSKLDRLLSNPRFKEAMAALVDSFSNEDDEAMEDDEATEDDNREE
ncbi:hypothetical protein OSB04_012952 [Centaurea solstitialis]|uniref:Uncharacterized protein n=1 Tax=Centaurea solstitialis TaxID=347529 RepID=A0AA38TX24_9ASTR|nr:hypothetical protein OSB04_012952 [Centaurea solstitialis]